MIKLPTQEEVDIQRKNELRSHPFDEMDPVWKDKWVTALRSDQYAQTSKVLRDDKGMCCLGVLCDLVDPTRWRLDTQIPRIIGPIVQEGFAFTPWAYFAETIEDEDYDDGKPFESCEDSELPQDVRRITGVTLHSMSRCIDLNDAQGKTFKEIADIVEEQM